MFYIALFVFFTVFYSELMGQNSIQTVRELPNVSTNPGQYFNIIDLSNKYTTKTRVIRIGPCGPRDLPKREPAYIINGKLYPSGSLSNLLPEDIASIEVLKKQRRLDGIPATG